MIVVGLVDCPAATETDDGLGDDTEVHVSRRPCHSELIGIDRSQSSNQVVSRGRIGGRSTETENSCWLGHWIDVGIPVGVFGEQ